MHDTQCTMHLNHFLVFVKVFNAHSAQTSSVISWCYMQTRRSPYLVHDTLLQIQNASANNTLKRPLKVQFIGEQGVDEGGVQKVHIHTHLRHALSHACCTACAKVVRVSCLRHTHTKCEYVFCRMATYTLTARTVCAATAQAFTALTS